VRVAPRWPGDYPPVDVTITARVLLTAQTRRRDVDLGLHTFTVDVDARALSVIQGGGYAIVSEEARLQRGGITCPQAAPRLTASTANASLFDYRVTVAVARHGVDVRVNNPTPKDTLTAHADLFQYFRRGRIVNIAHSPNSLYIPGWLSAHSTTACAASVMYPCPQ
jgi:hypothetical protein